MGQEEEQLQQPAITITQVGSLVASLAEPGTSNTIATVAAAVDRKRKGKRDRPKEEYPCRKYQVMGVTKAIIKTRLTPIVAVHKLQRYMRDQSCFLVTTRLTQTLSRVRSLLPGSADVEMGMNSAQFGTRRPPDHDLYETDLEGSNDSGDYEDRMESEDEDGGGSGNFDNGSDRDRDSDQEFLQPQQQQQRPQQEQTTLSSFFPTASTTSSASNRNNDNGEGGNNEGGSASGKSSSSSSTTTNSSNHHLQAQVDLLVARLEGQQRRLELQEAATARQMGDHTAVIAQQARQIEELQGSLEHVQGKLEAYESEQFAGAKGVLTGLTRFRNYLLGNSSVQEEARRVMVRLVKQKYNKGYLLREYERGGYTQEQQLLASIFYELLGTIVQQQQQRSWQPTAVGRTPKKDGDGGGAANDRDN